MFAAPEDLQSVLDEFDAWIRVEHAALYPCLRPGLSARELDLLAQTLLPYYLPAEFEVLYRWHDGWDSTAGDGFVSLLPDSDFLPLADAIGSYRSWWDALGDDGWHRLWFPAFGTQHGELVALQLEPHLPAGQVYGYHAELDLSTSYDSVAALFTTALDLWQRGLLPDDSAYPEITRILGERNPGSRTPDGVPRQEVSRWSTLDWPAPWRDVLGVGPMAPADDGEIATIAELAAGRAHGRPVRAELKGIGGSSDRFFATATDGTGSATVFFMRDATENFREASGGGRYDLWLEPLLEGHAAAELGESLRPFAEVGQVLYFVSKVVPL